MKNDSYIKFILTIIALCLIWICIRDLKLGGNLLFAKDRSVVQDEVYVTGGELDVRIVGCKGTAFSLAEPIQVEVVN